MEVAYAGLIVESACSTKMTSISSTARSGTLAGREGMLWLNNGGGRQAGPTNEKLQFRFRRRSRGALATYVGAGGDSRLGCALAPVRAQPSLMQDHLGRPLRIVYVYDGDWPKGAIRVHKETCSLAIAGHVVHLVCRNETRHPRRVVEKHVTVRRLPEFGPSWFNHALNFPYFFNPLWFWEIFQAAKELRADSILVADLPLAPTALCVGKLFGIPVDFDMVEVYPEFLRSLWEFEDMGGLDHVVRNPRLADLIERWVIRKFRTVFVVSEESRQRCERLGVFRTGW